MNHAMLIVVCGVLIACGGTAAPQGQTTPTTPTPTFTRGALSFSDEFDAADGSAPDPSRWVYEIGGGGWGNQELETYTDRRDNSFVRGGMLVIKAAKETLTGPDGRPRDYTSARLRTFGRFSQAYGRFEARIKIPRGQGIWPAFWMLGDDINTAGWPTCGEIDIMENIGREPSIIHGTMHGPGYSGDRGIGAPFPNPAGAPFADDFHVYGVDWAPNAVRWDVDGHVYHTVTPAQLPAGTKWVFDHPFYIILNVAVGGTWPGSPDATTVFPQEMLVDWVRVYRRE